MMSAGSAAYSAKGRASPVAGSRLVVTGWSGGLLQLAVADRLAVGEAGVETVPVRDLRFPQLPAQEHQAVAVQGVEVEQAGVEVLDQAAAPMDGAHAVGDQLGQGVVALLEPAQVQ